MNFTHTQLDAAYHWLCRQRKHFPPNADIWWFRFNYQKLKNEILTQVNQGQYCFSPQQKIIKADASIIHLWSSQDALVMKLLADKLQDCLQISSCCTHIKGHGGLKQAISNVQDHLSEYKYFCKTDIYHYYETIDQHLLTEMVSDTVSDPVLRP